MAQCQCMGKESRLPVADAMKYIVKAMMKNLYRLSYELLKAEIYNDEDWLVLIASDHGGTQHVTQFKKIRTVVPHPCNIKGTQETERMTNSAIIIWIVSAFLTFVFSFLSSNKRKNLYHGNFIVNLFVIMPIIQETIIVNKYKSGVFMRDKKYDAIIVGAGLSGLSCAYKLVAKNKKVLVIEKQNYAGGRTSSFIDNSMPVESGLHRYIGYYSAMPKLLKKCGVKIGDIVTWEEKADILIKNENKKLVLGLAPFFAPVKTLRGVLGNNDILSVRDKLSLTAFFICGFTSYIFSDNLDNYSVSEYANKHGVSEKSKRLILEPLSSGIFFMPPENYSAYAFFGLFAPAIPKFYKMRIGAFLGGMTDVMCNPIVGKIKSLGGDFIFNKEISSVIYKNNTVTGVQSIDGECYYADNVVVATTLSAAKDILRPLKNHKSFDSFFSLPVMSACTFQLELNKPALKKDITTFAPGTDMVSFAEQSRSTFRNLKGRLSVILGNPEEYSNKSPETILEIVKKQMSSLGVNLDNSIIHYRKVSEKNEFYSLDKGNQKLRPMQKTAVNGLVLAGDYTLTSSFATMEGAVISGKKAAKICLKK